MSTLSRYLYPLPARRSTGSIVAWWERRRLGYNLLVGSAGMVSLAGVYGFSFLTGSPPDEWYAPVLVFGIGANLYYTLGWVIESAVNALWGDSVAPVGPALSRAGIIFSVGLALLPTLVLPVALVGWVLGNLL